MSTYRVPADAWAVWQHRTRISRSAGESAFANEDMTEMSEVERVWSETVLLHKQFVTLKGWEIYPRLPVDLNVSKAARCSTRPRSILDIAMDDDEQKQQQDDWLSSRKNRLPSFTEVLSRRTRPPVDLFMF